MTTYTNPYTGQTISPSQVGYESLTIAADTELQWPINGNTSDVVANIIEVDAKSAGLNLIMPPATQVSNGQSTLIRNIGAETFTVVDNSLNTIVSIASGIAEYIYVTDNSTIDGVWETVTFGAGTSAANAATLAGYGLRAINTTLNRHSGDDLLVRLHVAPGRSLVHVRVDWWCWNHHTASFWNRWRGLVHHHQK